MEKQKKRSNCLITILIVTGFVFALLLMVFIFKYYLFFIQPVDPSPVKNTKIEKQAKPKGTFSEEEIDYFIEVALASEYGDDRKFVKKWAKSPRISVSGTPTESDMNCLNEVIADFNSLTKNIDIIKTDGVDSDIKLNFIPLEKMADEIPGYISGNEGYFTYYFDDDYVYSAIIGIASDKPSPEARCHLIREELTQSMGLANDSNKYPGSIFYVEWETNNHYTDLDKKLIQMLYSTDIPVGSNEEETRAYFTLR